MVNGDTYYVTTDDAERLRETIEGSILRTWGVRDLKTNNRITLVLTNISAIVSEVPRG